MGWYIIMIPFYFILWLLFGKDWSKKDDDDSKKK